MVVPSFQSSVSEDDIPIFFFFPVNSSGGSFSDFYTVWKCAIDIVFDACADVFRILNNGRESF